MRRELGAINPNGIMHMHRCDVPLDDAPSEKPPSQDSVEIRSLAGGQTYIVGMMRSISLVLFSFSRGKPKAK